MGRVFLHDDRIKNLTHSLVLLYLQEGSVNAVCTALNAFSPGKIHPNRIHSILSLKENTAVNDRTVSIIEEAVKKISSTQDKYTPTIKKACKDLLAFPIDKISERTKIPQAVLKFTLGNYENDVLTTLVRELGEIKAEFLVKNKEKLVPLLETLVEFGSQYLRMLKSLN